LEPDSRLDPESRLDPDSRLLESETLSSRLPDVVEVLPFEVLVDEL